MNKREEKRKKMAEKKYQWKVTIGFEEVNDKNGVYYDGGVILTHWFDTIDEAMDYIESCVTHKNEEPVDLVSNEYLWKKRPSFDVEETRIRTKHPAIWCLDTVDYIMYIIERVKRN